MTNGSELHRKRSFVLLLVLTAGALYVSFLIARPFLSGIVFAILLAVATYPAFAALLRHVRNRGAAALLITVAVLLVLILPTMFVVKTIADETRAVYGWLNEQSPASGGWDDVVKRVTDKPMRWIEQTTGISREQVRSAAARQFENVSSSLVNWATSLAANITGTALNTVIMLLALFYFLRDGPAILARIAAILPIEPSRYDQLLKAISDSMLANFYGVIAVSLVQSILGFIGYWIAGLPNLMLWTVMTAFFSIIPALGAAVVWGAGVIYLGLTGHWGKALFLLLYGTGVISLSDNVVRPLVLSGRAKLNALLVFFSLLGGVQVFGIVGLFVGPIVVSVAIALLRIITEERVELEQGSPHNGQGRPG